MSIYKLCLGTETLTCIAFHLPFALRCARTSCRSSVIPPFHYSDHPSAVGKPLCLFTEPFPRSLTSMSMGTAPSSASQVTSPLTARGDHFHLPFISYQPINQQWKDPPYPRLPLLSQKLLARSLLESCMEIQANATSWAALPHGSCPLTHRLPHSTR